MNQQWPYNPETPHGAWEYHEHLIPNSPRKPIRIWMEVGDRDLLITRDNYHDWVLANENMAKVLAAKGYHYQFVFARNAGHQDRTVNSKPCPRRWNMSGGDTRSSTPETDACRAGLALRRIAANGRASAPSLPPFKQMNHEIRLPRLHSTSPLPGGRNRYSELRGL